MISPDYILFYLPRANGSFGKILENFGFFWEISKYNLGLKILYILYLQSKKQFKIQIIGILEGIDSFY